VEDAREFLAGKSIDAVAKEVDGKFMGAFIRSVKSTRGASCCAPTCCN
jgi:hypothetical protein